MQGYAGLTKEKGDHNIGAAKLHFARTAAPSGAAAVRPVAACQTSKTRVRARLDIWTERLAQIVASRRGARSASEM